MSTLYEKKENFSVTREVDIENGELGSVNGTLETGIAQMDEAARYAASSGRVERSESEEARLLWKIDWALMPLVSLLYSMFYVEKASNSFAAVMGLRDDMHMRMGSDQYAWTSSAFYLAYMCFEPIAGWTLQSFPLTRTFSIYMILWALIVCLQASNENYAAFVALRTLLGCAEASASIFATLLTAQYYKKSEAFLRVSFWLSTSGFGICFGNLVAYGIAQRSGDFSIAPWKILFIVFGLIALFLGAVLYLHVPNVPAKAWFLTPKERLMAVNRIRENYQGFGNKKWKKYQFLEALKDPRTYLFFFYAVSFNIQNSGLSSFGSILLKDDLGYSSTDALLYGTPQGAVEFICLPIAAYIIQKFNLSRLFCTAIVITISVAFACMLAFSNSTSVKLAGYYLLGFMQIGPIGCFSYFASNIPGHTKKITITVVYLIGYSVGSLIGPQTWTGAPHYVPAKITIVVCLAVAATCIYSIFFLCLLDNWKRDKKMEESPNIEVPRENIEFGDMTDKENIFFRFTL